MCSKRWFALSLAMGLLLLSITLFAMRSSAIASSHTAPAPGAGNASGSIAPTEVITLNATADTTVNNSYPTTNYGTLITLEVQSGVLPTGAPLYQRTLLRFDLGAALPVNAAIDSAVLGLYLQASGGELRAQMTAANLTADWIESGREGVTWNTQPAAGDVVVTPLWASATLNEWQSWNITLIAQAWQSGKNFGLVLRGADGAAAFARIFSSRECLGRDCGTPRLVVNYHLLPTATPTATRSSTPIPTATRTHTPSSTATRSPTPTETTGRVTFTPSPTVTTGRVTDTPTPTTTASVTRVTLTPPPTRTPTTTPTNTLTPTRTRTPTRTATRTPTQTPVTADLWVTHLEVTQGIQDLGNTVPLVARKRTYVRAHVKSNGGTYPNVRAEFSFGHSAGPPTGRIPADNPNSRITVKANPDRAQKGDSYYIEIPPEDLVAGTLYCHVYLNPDHEPLETNYDNNNASVILELTESPQVKLKLYYVRYYGAGQWRQASLTDMTMMVSWLRRAYPTAGVNWVMRQLLWTDVITPGLAGCGAVNNRLTAERYLEGNPPQWRYYGMVTDKGGWMRGCAVDIPSYVASGPTGSPGGGSWDTDASYGDWYGAHELGHTYGRSHVLCRGDEAGADASYPYPGGKIGGTSQFPTRFYGWDTEQRVVYTPTWTDMMTYCSYEWLSDYGYKGIRARLSIEGWSAAQAPEVLDASQAPAEYLAVFGLANLTQGTAELGTLLRWQTAGEPPTPSADWTLALRGSGGVPLASYPFTPKVDSDAAPGEDVKGSILETVPWAEGTTRVVVLYQGNEVAGRAVSAHAPTVEVTYPNGGEVLSGPEVTVTWSGTDEDGDALTYAIQYSADASAHWQTVGVALKDTQLAVPLSEVPGSETALFRVIVSDGVNTGQDQSNAVFTVQRKAPQAFVISPDPGGRYSLGQQVMLVGEGYDAEDGSLPDGGLNWSSDLQGTLGTGAQVAVTSLQEGQHVITLRATDSDVQSGTATVTIYVGLPSATIYLPVVVKRSL